MKTHTGEKPMNVMSLDAKRNYAQSNHLRDHKRNQSTHTGERTYKVMNVERLYSIV